MVLSCTKLFESSFVGRQNHKITVRRSELSRWFPPRNEHNPPHQQENITSRHYRIKIMDSTLNASPNNQVASEKDNNIKMDGKEAKEDTEDPVKEEEKPAEEKPQEEEKAAPESEKEEDKEATENAAAALTSLHESTNAPKEEKGSDKEEDGDEEDDDEPRDDSNFSIPLKVRFMVLESCSAVWGSHFPLSHLNLTSCSTIFDIKVDQVGKKACDALSLEGKLSLGATSY